MRTTTLILTGITCAALSVSFFSSFKEKNIQMRARVFREEIEKLKRNKKIVETTLASTQERLDQEAEVNKELKQNLAREEMRNIALSQELQRQQKALQNAQNTQVKNQVTSSQIQQKVSQSTAAPSVKTPARPTPKTNFGPVRNADPTRIHKTDSPPIATL